MEKFIVITIGGNPGDTLSALVDVTRDEENDIKDKIMNHNNFATIEEIARKNLSPEELTKNQSVLSQLTLASAFISTNPEVKPEIVVTFLAVEGIYYLSMLSPLRLGFFL